MLIWELYVKHFCSSIRYGELHMKHFSSSHRARAFTWSTSFIKQILECKWNISSVDMYLGLTSEVLPSAYTGLGVTHMKHLLADTDCGVKSKIFLHRHRSGILTLYSLHSSHQWIHIWYTAIYYYITRICFSITYAIFMRLTKI
jgi:hypothetical protein